MRSSANVASIPRRKTAATRRVIVLDASALLALVNQSPDWEVVTRAARPTLTAPQPGRTLNQHRPGRLTIILVCARHLPAMSGQTPTGDQQDQVSHTSC